MARSAARSRGFMVASTFTAAPAITGTAQVGQTLTGSNGTIAGGTFASRRWLRDGAAISGATGATYVVQAADVGKRITQEVTATVTATGGKVSKLSAPTAIVIA
ncbi:hypothetical protein [Sphingomonas paucimobilis]|uniref:hypothetical protein n=1 Tax=Sphingomonas paucimobilis TaxID=13689 RepID=UPI002041731A|nr:hypothetical protein [Sphingomonas paucimobilis]MCM3680257.1 hypothetical protein [Sphingomonas paucimobilis]